MPNSPPSHLIHTAADLRALGNAWERIADELGCPLAEVREWPHRYPSRWKKAFDRAVQRTLEEATSEALLSLRKQLRSKDEKSVREASLKLAQVCVMLDKSRRPAKGDARQSSNPPGYADHLLKSVRGMTDAQLEAAILAETQG